MTRAVIRSGSCGFFVTVLAEKKAERIVLISLETKCEMVRKMAEDIRELDWKAAFTGFAGNIVYRSAAMHLTHVACPVPAGILKVLEVELGFNVARDAAIQFVKDEGPPEQREEEGSSICR